MTTDHPLVIAQDAGRKAFLDGVAKSANPYPKGSDLHTAWKDGWVMAKRED
jgi:hypothetical protein